MLWSLKLSPAQEVVLWSIELMGGGEYCNVITLSPTKVKNSPKTPKISPCTILFRKKVHLEFLHVFKSFDPWKNST